MRKAKVDPEQMNIFVDTPLAITQCSTFSQFLDANPAPTEEISYACTKALMHNIEIGHHLWCVTEHLYDHGKIEYCVCEGTVCEKLPNRAPEICLHGRGPDGYVNLWYYKVAEIGKKVFLTSREAAMYAQELTDKYESTGLFKYKEREPLRRTWAKYLIDSEAPNDMPDED